MTTKETKLVSDYFGSINRVADKWRPAILP